MFNWLNRYQELEGEMEYMEFNLQRSKRELKRWVSGDLQDIRLTATSEGAKIEERIVAMEYELAHKTNDLYDLKQIIGKFKGLDHQILKMKYVDGMTLEQIAETSRYSSSHIKKKHAEIIRLIKFIEREGII
ncbi:hypothetical protein PDQ79_10490 [Bacillus cereus]|nr:hypothetical protein [Bacillus cereus]